MNTEKLSGWILKILLAVIAIVFILFAFVGFDTPYEEDPKMVAPVMTDAVLVLCLAFIVVGIVAAIWSAIKQITTGNTTSKDTGIANRTGLISTIIFVVSILVGVVVGVANKDEVMLINGESWNVPSDIILADTCIYSIAILLIVTIVVTFLGLFGKAKK